MLLFLFLVLASCEGRARGVLLGARGVADCKGAGNDGRGGVVSSGTGAGIWVLESGGVGSDEGVIVLGV